MIVSCIYEALKSVLNNRGFGDKGIEVKLYCTVLYCTNCTNVIIQSRCMGYENCLEKESECSCDEVFEKFVWSVTNE